MIVIRLLKRLWDFLSTENHYQRNLAEFLKYKSIQSNAELDYWVRVYQRYY